VVPPKLRPPNFALGRELQRAGNRRLPGCPGYGFASLRPKIQIIARATKTDRICTFGLPHNDAGRHLSVCGGTAPFYGCSVCWSKAMLDVCEAPPAQHSLYLWRGRENPKTVSKPTSPELAIRAEKIANGHRAKRFVGSQLCTANNKNGITGIEYLAK
jgi:hypothetical protein